MNKTLIDMLTAINEPEAIERAYQIMAAKRDLLAYKDKPAFKHSVMGPKPLVDAYCPDMADIMRTSSVKPTHPSQLPVQNTNF